MGTGLQQESQPGSLWTSLPLSMPYRVNNVEFGVTDWMLSELPEQYRKAVLSPPAGPQIAAKLQSPTDRACKTGLVIPSIKQHIILHR